MADIAGRAKFQKESKRYSKSSCLSNSRCKALLFWQSLRNFMYFRTNFTTWNTGLLQHISLKFFWPLLFVVKYVKWKRYSTKSTKLQANLQSAVYHKYRGYNVFKISTAILSIVFVKYTAKTKYFSKWQSFDCHGIFVKATFNGAASTRQQAYDLQLVPYMLLRFPERENTKSSVAGLTCVSSFKFSCCRWGTIFHISFVLFTSKFQSVSRSIYWLVF